MPARSREDAAHLRRDVAMVTLAILSIAILAAEEFGQVPAAYDTTLLYLDLAIVGVFWVEYLARLRVAPNKRAFVRANWYDLPGMIPILPGMESLGGARFFRLLRILRILRLVGALRRFDRFNRFIERFTRKSKLGYVAVLTLAIIVTCATLAWTVEPETFPTLFDAMWWGVVTATTVGYGDFYPHTGIGRIVGVVLMFLGVGLIGVFSATLSSVLIERRAEEQQEARDAASSGAGIAGQLERLAHLHERGALSPEEFAAAKRKLLSR
ncbi:MAG TPA: ion transporter [Candidatus Thermoplasmatota archaeon]|nr:ion transporter [Candidatus Thermoplasmatota archaeon]